MHYFRVCIPRMSESAPSVIQPAPFHVSGQRPYSVLRGLLCVAGIMGFIWLMVFVGVCILLYRTNTPEVHVNCPGFWDFTLVSVLSPLLLPLLYLLSSSALTISWNSFSTAWLLGMSLFSVATTLSATLNFNCVETLRTITPPFPWLVFVGWVKSIMYFAGTVSYLKRIHPTV